MSESDDEVPQLSSAALAALQEYYKEKEDQEQRLNYMSVQPVTTNVTFDENWQLSQFWYDEETVNCFVNGMINSTGDTGKIALISCPTLYNKMKKDAGDRQGYDYLLVQRGFFPPYFTLFEYDQRFAIFGPDFIPYDYKSPLDIPRELANHFDLVVADPPFLSEECLTKTAVTIKFLTKNNIVLCTGAIMTDLAARLLDVKKCSFEPRHKNNLANEFWCFSNFDFDKNIEINK